MKVTDVSKAAALMLVLGMAAAGCRKNPYNVSNIPSAPRAHVEDVQPDPIPPIQLPDETQVASQPDTSMMIPLADSDTHSNWVEDASAFNPYTTHFAYDSSAIRTSEKPKVVAVADYLKSNQAQAVRVEGHCDERGTEEYNRALGERRALAVREELIRLGIDAKRVDTLSYGEDRPAEPGHNENAWRENRRAQFILLTPPNQTGGSL